MPQYIYKKRLMQIFDEFANEKNPQTNKRLRSEKSINNVYKYRIEEFIDQQLSKDDNYQLEIMDISVEHINSFLSSVKSDLVMYSRVLNSFFKFTYKNGYTHDISLGIRKQVQSNNPISFISEDHCKQISDFIKNKEKDFNDRLIIALFYFTGLKLQLLCDLKVSSFSDDYSIMWISAKEGEKRPIPVNTVLQKLLYEKYARLREKYEFVNPDSKIISLSDNNTTVTTRVKTISLKITGCAYPPTSFEKTFKKRALKIDCNPYLVAKLTLSEISAVSKYIDNDISVQQQRILIEKF